MTGSYSRWSFTQFPRRSFQAHALYCIFPPGLRIIRSPLEIYPIDNLFNKEFLSSVVTSEVEVSPAVFLSFSLRARPPTLGAEILPSRDVLLQFPNFSIECSGYFDSPHSSLSFLVRGLGLFLGRCVRSRTGANVPGSFFVPDPRRLLFTATNAYHADTIARLTFHFRFRLSETIHHIDNTIWVFTLRAEDLEFIAQGLLVILPCGANANPLAP